MKEKVRVLFLNHVAGLGGAERMLLNLLKGIDRTSIEPIVCCMEEGQLCEQCRAEEIDVYVLKGKSSLINMTRNAGLIQTLEGLKPAIKIISSLSKLVKKESIDIIYTNSIKAHILGTIVAKAAKKPIIWRLHDVIDASSFSKFGQKLLVIMAKHATHISCVSQAVADSLIKQGVSSERLSVIYNGVDDFINPQIRDRERIFFRSEWGLSEHEIAVGLIARPILGKGQECFIEAASLLCGLQQNLKFLIIGGPVFPGEKDFEDNLKVAVNNYKLGHNFIFTGHLDNIREALAGLDIVVNASIISDSLPTVVIEAMIAGKPIVATKVGGIPEMIKADQNGILVEPDNGKALASGIERAILAPELRSKIAKNAREDALNKFDMVRYISALNALIREIHHVDSEKNF